MAGEVARPLILLLWIVVIVAGVVGANMIIDRNIPSADVKMMAKIVVGLIGLIFIIYLLLPYFPG